MKALLIADSQETVRDVSFCLGMAWPDFTPVFTADVDKALEMVDGESPDIVFLSLTLQGRPRVDMAEKIRLFSDVLLLLLVTEESEVDKASGLEAGADGLVTLPINPLRLQARVRALMRRAYGLEFGPERGTFVDGDVVINLTTREVFRSSQRVPVTPTEYKLLSLLVRNRGKVLGHRMLLERVWGANYDDVAYVKKYIHRLRQKLGDDSQYPHMIVSERGMGYRFASPQPSAIRPAPSPGPWPHLGSALRQAQDSARGAGLPSLALSAA